MWLPTFLSLQILGTLAAMLADALYLSANAQLYAPVLGLAKRVRAAPAVVAWSLLVAALQTFALRQEPGSSALLGMLLGAYMYGLYNAVNLATIDAWSLELATRDTAWGAVLSSALTLLMSAVTPWARPEG